MPTLYPTPPVDTDTAVGDRRARIEQLPEQLVHDIWGRREYDHRSLETVSGLTVVVLDTGEHNRDEGPDFLTARVRIGRTEWIGDVEIHRTSSEWMHHRHDRDPRYNRVVLHVTLVADLWTGSLRRHDGTLLPEIVLAGFLRKPLRKLLVQMYRAADATLPCEASWPRMPAEVAGPFVDEMSLSRLDRRTRSLLAGGTSTDDIDEAVFGRVMATLGYSKNQQAMMELADRVPLSVLRHLSDAGEAEALLLGTAALIPDPGAAVGSDEDIAYVDRLRKRYTGLLSLSKGPPMTRTAWRFFRLRPPNFPPLRIAQAAALASEGFLATPDVASRTLGVILRSEKPVAALRQHLAVALPPFWLSHVRLERPVRGGPTSLGTDRIDRIILNALLPAANQAASRVGAPPEFRKVVRDVLTSMPPEDDEITRIFDGFPAGTKSATTTQGLHEIHATLCRRHGCLRCTVGRFILTAHSR